MECCKVPRYWSELNFIPSQILLEHFLRFVWLCGLSRHRGTPKQFQVTFGAKKWQKPENIQLQIKILKQRKFIFIPSIFHNFSQNFLPIYMNPKIFEFMPSLDAFIWLGFFKNCEVFWLFSIGIFEKATSIIVKILKVALNQLS